MIIRGLLFHNKGREKSLQKIGWLLFSLSTPSPHLHRSSRQWSHSYPALGTWYLSSLPVLHQTDRWSYLVLRVFHCFNVHFPSHGHFLISMAAMLKGFIFPCLPWSCTERPPGGPKECCQSSCSQHLVSALEVPIHRRRWIWWSPVDMVKIDSFCSN